MMFCNPSQRDDDADIKGTKTELKLKHDRAHSYTVIYNSESHWEVLFQMFGSVWPTIFPYCLSNVAIMLGLRIARDYGGEMLHDLVVMLELGNSSRKFTNFVMAFLVVTRIKMSLDRYSDARTNIGSLYREAREIIQNAVVFTNTQSDQRAKDWRHDMSYQTLLLLRTAMAVLNFSVREESAWKLPELNETEREKVLRNLLINPENAHYGIDQNTEFEENMRVPILVSYMLTETVVNQRARLEEPLAIPQENKLFASIDSFSNSYNGLRKFLTTPTPFPLIQMSATFLTFYVFTIPCVLLSDDSGLVAHLFFTFLITMGFMGLNAVAVELDNPFGDDPNDFK